MITRTKYVKGQNGKKLGVVALIYTEGYFGVGVSLCNEEDKFDNRVGTGLAIERAEKVRKENPLYLKDLTNLTLAKVSQLTGCSIPLGMNCSTSEFLKGMHLMDTLSDVVTDMIYTLAIDKVKSESK